MQNQPSPRVLYVEDEPVIRRVVVRSFEEDGIEVRTAAEGREGVALAFDWHPDLILMDLMMPIMDGFAAAKVLRSDARTHDIPIVAYSGSPPGPATRRAIAAGFDAFVPKTAPHRELISTVRERIDRQAA